MHPSLYEQLRRFFLFNSNIVFELIYMSLRFQLIFLRSLEDKPLSFRLTSVKTSIALKFQRGSFEVICVYFVA